MDHDDMHKTNFLYKGKTALCSIIVFINDNC